MGLNSQLWLLIAKDKKYREREPLTLSTNVNRSTVNQKKKNACFFLSSFCRGCRCWLRLQFNFIFIFKFLNFEILKLHNKFVFIPCLTDLWSLCSLLCGLLEILFFACFWVKCCLNNHPI